LLIVIYPTFVIAYSRTYTFSTHCVVIYLVMTLWQNLKRAAEKPINLTLYGRCEEWKERDSGVMFFLRASID